MSVRNPPVDFTLIRMVGSLDVPVTPPASRGTLTAASMGGHTAPTWTDESGVSVRLTRDLLLLIRNNSGSSIARGAAVRFTGSTGVTPTIGLADADVFDSGRPRAAVGLAIETIANNAFGAIILSGLISNLDTSAFTEGATIFLSTTPGTLTGTAPNTAGCFVQPCGQVTRSHATQGSLELDFEVPATTLLANLTVGRVPFVGTGPILVDDAEFTYDATLNELTVPNILGGTTDTSDLTLRATSAAVPATGAKIILKAGPDTACGVEVLPDAGGNFSYVGINTQGLYSPVSPLNVYGVGADIGYLIRARAHFGGSGSKSGYLQVETAGGSGSDQQNAEAGFTFHQQYRQIEWRMAVHGGASTSMAWRCVQYGIGDDAYKAFFTTTGNWILNDSHSTPSAGTKCVILGDGTAPSGLASNTAALYADDVSGTVELFGINEAGQAVQLTAPPHVITAVFDGGGSVLAAKTVYVQIPYACKVTGWRLVGDASGTAVVDVWKSDYSSFPPVVGNSIAGSEKPTLSGPAQKNEDLTLSTWTDTTIDAGDYLAFALESGATVITWLSVQLLVRKGT